MRQEEKADRRWAGAVFLALSVLYWSLHCRTFGPGDSAQHVLSALTLGVSRPPGYPLYVLLAHLFSLLPFATGASLVDALSGLLQAAAAAGFFLALRKMKCGRAAAVTATALLSLSPLYWYYAEVAEVRGLNDLLAAASILACFTANPWLIGLSLGLGVSHHPTFVLTFPALLYLFSLSPRKPRDWAPLLISMAGACAAPYAFLYIRLHVGAAPVYNPDAVSSLSDVVRLFLRKKTGGLTGFAGGVPGLTSQPFEFARLGREGGWFLQLLWHDLTPPGILLLLLGAYRLFKTQKQALVFWLLWIAGTALPVIVLSSQEVRFGDLDYLRAIVVRHFLLAVIGACALAGFGADLLLSKSRKELGWALAAAALLCPLLLRPIDLRRGDPTLSYAEDIVRSSGPRDMIFVVSDEANFALAYLDLVEHKTEDRVFLTPQLFSEPAYIERLALRHPDLKLPRDGAALARSAARWMALNPDRPLEGEPTMRDTLIQVSSACYPQGILVRLGRRFPPPKESAAQARAFLDGSSAEKVPGWGLRPWTQEVYLLKAYAMILEFYGSFARRAGDAALSARLQKAFDAVISVR